MNVNPIFLENMKRLLGAEYENFINSLKYPIEKSIFVNQQKISIERFKQIVDFNVEQIQYVSAGFYVDNEKRGRHPLHHAGAFYLQEPSAMFTVNAHQFRGDEKVLDMCAAPGGKTIQIANLIPKGTLVSNEIVKTRSEILFSNVERMGLKNVIITNDTPENIAKAYGDSFDVCLVDAPCSGEGMFRRGENVLCTWHEGLNEMCAKRQLDILLQADKTLKFGGTLIYSTCTYSPLENEEVVKKFMRLKNYQLVNIPFDFTRGVGMPEAVRLYPHKVRGEGQFVAVLKKLDEDFYSHESTLKLSQSKITNDFFKRYINKDSEINTTNRVMEYKNYSYFVADCELIRKRVNYVSLGVRLGQVVGSRFEPHHNLFTAFGKDFEMSLGLSFGDEKVNKYLHGETFDTDLNDGYGAVLLESCALGGFKISAGKFKNLYPKGLRNFKIF